MAQIAKTMKSPIIIHFSVSVKVDQFMLYSDILFPPFSLVKKCNYLWINSIFIVHNYYDYINYNTTTFF